jgi:lipoyl(octanoyl) transferase
MVAMDEKMPAGNAPCCVIELGRLGYADACQLQQRLVAARKAGNVPNLLLFCEHPHVLTLGRNGRAEHLRIPISALEQMGVEFHHSNRGGDITYHGPGQIVGYPILQLGEIRRDVVWYVRQLEEVMIRASETFGVAAFRVPGRTGVWNRPAGNATCFEEKLGAIGVHISRWVTSHGFAYNVSTDLSYFGLIVPCGIADCRVTSVERLLGRPVATAEVWPRLAAEFGRAFGFEMQTTRRQELDEWLAAAEDGTIATAGATR